MATPTPASIDFDNSLKRSHRTDHELIQPEKPTDQEESYMKIYDKEVVKAYQTEKSSTSISEEAAPVDVGVVRKGSDAEGENGRERLKRHRMEMGGRVWIPDTWGQENLLKNWIDCTAFDASLVNNTILSARAALMQQRATTRPTNNLTLHRRIENRC